LTPLGLVILHVALSLLVGYLGRARSIGFAGYFVLSLLLSPLLMGLALLISLPKRASVER
jgi:hypothetical protein